MVYAIGNCHIYSTLIQRTYLDPPNPKNPQSNESHDLQTWGWKLCRLRREIQGSSGRGVLVKGKNKVL